MGTKLTSFGNLLSLFLFVDFSVPIKLWLIKVAAQPESSKILILFQSFVFLVSLVEAK